MIDIRIGDMRVSLDEMEPNSIDSCVTDPPYHLASIVKRFGAEGAAPAKSKQSGVYERSSRGFMGQTWDGGDVAFRPETWAKVLRVLKPGAHLLAFAASKNAHRLFCAVEDAGFEIRDTIMWLYGSGFPKSHNLEGEWGGWGTALKPAYEPIVVARKPLIGTVEKNVLAHGTGALNIDGCRVDIDPEIDDPHLGGKGAWTTTKEMSGDTVTLPGGTVASSPLGRWPANVIHDGSDEVLAGFPHTKSGTGAVKKASGAGYSPSALGKESRPAGTPNIEYGDEGSAARFFYCAKASKSDRDEGLDEQPDRVLAMSNQAKAELARGNMHEGSLGVNTAKVRKNNHPTVKPTDLMRYLCRLVTPPGGVVLDPFMGSGSTGKAAMLEGFRFIGCEMKEDYAAIAKARIEAAASAALAEMLS